MDPITIVTAALIIGASNGIKDVTSSAIKDSYEGLKGLIRNLFNQQDKSSAQSEVELLFKMLEKNPESIKEIFAEQLKSILPVPTEEIIEKASTLNKLAQKEGYDVNKYAVTVSNCNGVQIGDGTIQNNSF